MKLDNSGRKFQFSIGNALLLIAFLGAVILLSFPQAHDAVQTAKDNATATINKAVLDSE